MNAVVLPAPLRLQTIAAQTLTTGQAHSVLASFLENDAPLVLAGTGGAAATRASLIRLLDGLATTALLRKPVEKTQTSKDKTKKRKKGEGKREGKGKDASKRRKVEAL